MGSGWIGPSINSDFLEYRLFEQHYTIQYSKGVLGFDVKVLRQIIRLRKMDASDRTEMEELIDVYKRALEMN